MSHQSPPHKETNDCLLRMLCGQPSPRTPVWIMRQAGRYLPEYQATRAKAGSFMDLYRSAELATEVALQPLRRFDLDAAILFSDILTIPDAMGLGLHFVEGEGPRFERNIRSAHDVQHLPLPDIEKDLSYVMSSVRSIRAALAGYVPLIGFSGSPFTLACYMIEGGSSTRQDFRHAKTMMYQNPKTMHVLLKKNAQAVGEYLQAQLRAGAQVLMIFDSWGGMLSPHDYEAFSKPYIEEALSFVDQYDTHHQHVPRILYVRGHAIHHNRLHELPIQCLGIDWTVDPHDARRIVGRDMVLQGNLDPGVLLGSKAGIEQETQRLMQYIARNPRHIFNLGHGISQHTPPEHVSVMIETIRTYRQSEHGPAL